MQGLARWRQANSPVESSPDFARPFYQLGRAYYILQNIELSLAAYGRATEICPSFADAWNDRGNVLGMGEDWTKRRTLTFVLSRKIHNTGRPTRISSDCFAPRGIMLAWQCTNKSLGAWTEWNRYFRTSGPVRYRGQQYRVVVTSPICDAPIPWVHQPD